MNYFEQFKKNGYVIISNVFDENQLMHIRSILHKNFSEKNNPKLLNVHEINNSNIFLKDIFLNEKVLNVIQKIFPEEYYGKLSFFPPFQIMRNFFPRYSKHTWHIDASGEYRYDFCKKILRENDYLFGKIGIYLQKNTNMGGQIDIIKKSQINYSKFDLISQIKKNYLKLKMNFVKNLDVKNKFKFEKKILKYDRLDINVGDIIFFDSRIFHRATPIDPNNEIKINFEENNNYVKDLDEPSCKYALYYQFGNEKGFNSYWHDRSKRTDSIKEKEEWAQTKQLIKNFYSKKINDVPEIIKLSVKRISKII